MPLPASFVVDERYTVIRTLRADGPFSHLYLARETATDEEVHLVEYYPDVLVHRGASGDVEVAAGGSRTLFEAGLARFLDEHVRLRTLGHPNIVEERAAFEAHGTGYRVQTVEAGTSLDVVLERRGTLPREAALVVLMPLLEALVALHEAGLVHGALAPSAVWLSSSGRPLLRHLRHAELGLARRLEQSETPPAPGYAAPEQHGPDAATGPAADVYASAALLTHVLGGEALPPAPQRLHHDGVPALLARLDVSERLREALSGALALDPQARPPSMAAWLATLEAIWQAERDGAAGPASTPEAPPAETASDDDPPPVEAPTDAMAGTDPEPEEQPAEPSVPVVDEASDREPTPSRRGGRSRRAVMLAVVTALVALGGLTYGSTLLVHGDDGETPRQRAVTFLVAEGDSLHAAGRLEAAGQLYRRALELDAEDARATAQLDAVEAALAQRERRAFLRLVSQGDSLVAAGTALEADGETLEAQRRFDSATTFFLRALDLRPDDALVLGRLQRVTARSAEAPDAGDEPEELDPTAVRRQMFTMLRGQGERQLADGDTAAAVATFEQALALREDEALRGRLAEVRRVLDGQARRQQYAQAMERGRALVARGRRAEARLAFEQALALAPDDAAARQQLRLIERAVQDEENRVRRFEYLRAQGDLMAQQGELEAALKRYREARDYAADDTALQARITSVEQQMAERALHEEIEAQRRDADGVYLHADVQPELIGSRADLFREARYPQRAILNEVEGRVYMQLVVEADGSVSEVEVLRGIGAGCDEEAVRVVRGARFTPGTVDGRPVRVRHTLFIDFDLGAERRRRDD